MTSKYHTTLTLFIFLLIPALCFGENENLQNLDKALSKDYTSRKVMQLDSLKRVINISQDKWEGYHELAARYSNFNTDSALSYAIKARETATDRNRLRKSDIQIASLYNSSLMMYKEAYQIFKDIPLDSAETSFKKDYFTLGVQLYRNLEELAPYDSLRKYYAQRKRALRDSVLKNMPDEKFIRANELLDGGDPQGAINLFKDIADNPDIHFYNGAPYHLLAKAYQHLGDKDREIEFLALAAKLDIENGVKEYLALPQLALALYEKGDVARAYRYMKRSNDDAKSCNARVRIFDMTEAVSVISDAYASHQKSWQAIMTWLLIALCLLLLVTCISLIYARKHNRMLSEARSKLEESNRKLEVSGNVREKYVRRFMNLSREYIEYLNSYRASLFKTASKRNFDTLYNAIKSTRIIDQTTSTFYTSFDKAFLELYPDFVNEFNSLLRSEERIELKEEDTLNTELRIFALMKLGIRESAEIAKFLNCSQSTVYNYRTRYRAKAIDKDDFVNHFFS
ncbi:MAG: hypothetical protein K2H96_00785 [Muribaculaceae bacterium]|nr:hypothetical protein [Muribaculaceae bacterium]